MTEIKSPKKLIEVALPLIEINEASVREKSIRHGHPSTLHLWWARRPLATARAVLFAQLVNDPGYDRSLNRGVSREKAEIERERLFGIIRELVKWENINNESILAQARTEIMKSWQETCNLNRDHPLASDLFNPEKIPPFHDPFAGGGAIPHEAQRLGLEAWASDLNPVAVLINKAMIEIPPTFGGLPPVHPIAREQGRLDSWQGATGLAKDVQHYGQWMRDEAERRIGYLYPKVQITEKMVSDRPDLQEYVGSEMTVIAWIWTRTVKSPNPAFRNVEVPLVRSFWLSTKEGKETWVEPVIRSDSNGYDFIVRTTGKPSLEGTISRQGGVCIMSGSPMDFKYIRSEGMAGRMGQRLLAVVLEGRNKRIYLSPSEEMTKIIPENKPVWKSDVKIPIKHRNFQTPAYGMPTFGDLFTLRQLCALNTFCDLIGETNKLVKKDAIAAGMPDNGQGLENGGNGATAYADAISVYLSFAVDKIADRNSTLTAWATLREHSMNTYSRQALPMTWDFAESNPFSQSSGNFLGGVKSIYLGLNEIQTREKGFSYLSNVITQKNPVIKIISTDPPYYDNICYADLSDYFYVWLRRSLKSIFPSLFATMAVPKLEELVATINRHGSKQAAEVFFMEGMTKALQTLEEQSHPAFPVTIYYAFKQSETKDAGTTSTGWETFLDAILRSGFITTGTWPMRTERIGNLKKEVNALASSIVLVCRKRDSDAATISRTNFLRILKNELPEALLDMTGGKEGSTPIAPVDLAQASIGPGMAIFSRYSAVLDADGTPLSVHDALILINKVLDEHLSEAEGDLDPDTRFCIQWFEEYGWKEGPFGIADTLARAKGTSVEGVSHAGVLSSGSGKVRLIKVDELPSDWNPETDPRIPVWEALHHLSRTLQNGGEVPAGALLNRIPTRSQQIRQLAYRLYTLCERKGWAEDARIYNELIITWHPIETAAIERRGEGPQRTLDIGDE